VLYWRGSILQALSGQTLYSLGDRTLLKFHPPNSSVAHHKKIIKELTEYTRKYHRLYELQAWEIDVHFEDVPRDDKGVAEVISFESATADCTTQPQYFISVVKYFIDVLIEKDRLDDLEVYPRHELIHVVLSPYTHTVSNIQSDLSIHKKIDFDGTADFAEETLVSVMERWKFWDKLK